MYIQQASNFDAASEPSQSVNFIMQWRNFTRNIYWHGREGGGGVPTPAVRRVKPTLEQSTFFFHLLSWPLTWYSQFVKGHCFQFWFWFIAFLSIAIVFWNIMNTFIIQKWMFNLYARNQSNMNINNILSASIYRLHEPQEVWFLF